MPQARYGRATKRLKPASVTRKLGAGQADGIIIATGDLTAPANNPNTPPVAKIAAPAAGFSVAVGVAVTLDPTGTFDAESGWIGTWTVRNTTGTVRFTFTGTFGSFASHVTTWTPTVAESVVIDWLVTDAQNATNLAQVSGTVTAQSVPTTLTIAPSSWSLNPGQTIILNATVKDQFGVAMSGQSFAWSSANTARATVNPATGSQTTVTAQSQTGAVNITCTSGALNATSAGNVTALATGLFPSQPAGYIVPAGFERDFNSTGEGAWSFIADPRFVIRDASIYNPGAGVTPPSNPPASPFNIGEATFTTSTQQGTAPITTFIPGGTMSAQNWTKLYFAAYVQLSSNFQSHPSGTNKVFIIDIGGFPCFILSAQNGTQWQIRLQDLPSAINAGHGAADFAGGSVTQGLWQLVEVVLTANTPGVADGTIQLWQSNFNSSGVKISGPTATISGAQASFDAGIPANQIGWVPSGTSNKWGSVLWQPVWGGNIAGTTISSQFYIWVDKIRVAGAA